LKIDLFTDIGRFIMGQYR